MRQRNFNSKRLNNLNGIVDGKLSDRQLIFAGLGFSIVIVAWLVLFFYSIHAALPFNPVKLPFQGSIPVRSVMTQGWKFFTRSPREEDIRVFELLSDGTSRSASRGSNASPSNLFGIKRDSRAQGIEIGLITSGLRKDQWRECKTKSTECVPEVDEEITVSNTIENPTICGRVMVSLVPPVPWAWSGSKREVTMPSKIAILNVICSESP